MNGVGHHLQARNSNDDKLGDWAPTLVKDTSTQQQDGNFLPYAGKNTQNPPTHKPTTRCKDGKWKVGLYFTVQKDKYLLRNQHYQRAKGT